MGSIQNTKFCTRKPGTCTVTAHTQKKFQAQDLTGYLRETEIRAFCSPGYGLSELSTLQIKRLQEVQLTTSEWQQLFQQLTQGDTPKWLAFEDSTPHTDKLEIDTVIPDLPDEDELISPLAQWRSGGLMNLIPVLSFDDSITSSSSPEFIPEDLDLTDLAAYVGRFRLNFHSLKQKWAKAFTEVEAGYGLLVQDFRKLSTNLLECSQAIGDKEQGIEVTAPTLWTGLHRLRNSLESLAGSLDGHDKQIATITQQHTCLSHNVTLLKTTTDQLSSEVPERITTIERDLRGLEQRLLKLLPILAQLKHKNMTPTPTFLPPNLTQRIADCETQIHTLHELVSDNILNPTTGPSPQLNTHVVPPSPTVNSSDLSAQFKELQAQMKQLQLRVIGKGVQIANRTFQSFDDVKLWVITHLPTRRYGLFVDGVSILEFFTHGHIDAETTYSSFYSQHRTGFQSTYEARIASSIQNLFPTVFGKTDSNVDTSEALPALKSPDKWDSNDGNTGLRYQISRNMGDVELQLQETIATVLADYTEAKHVAQECLHQSKRFVLELSQFITTDFQKWRHRGHAPKEAWKMTSVCVRRIFEELYSERVVARDIYDQKDPDFTTAKYLWATWKAHAVMDRYLRHQFYEHPAISAVLARHLADNYVKPDDSQGAKIKALEAKIKSMESAHQSEIRTLEATQATLQSKYDSLRVEMGKLKEHKEPKDGKDKGKNWKGNPASGSG